MQALVSAAGFGLQRGATHEGVVQLRLQLHGEHCFLGHDWHRETLPRTTQLFQMLQPPPPLHFILPAQIARLGELELVG
jgi:hypothetical protein